MKRRRCPFCKAGYVTANLGWGDIILGKCLPCNGTGKLLLISRFEYELHAASWVSPEQVCEMRARAKTPCHSPGIGSRGDRAFSMRKSADCYAGQATPRALPPVPPPAYCCAGWDRTSRPRDGQDCSDARVRQPIPVGCKAHNLYAGWLTPAQVWP